MAFCNFFLLKIFPTETPISPATPHGVWVSLYYFHFICSIIFLLLKPPKIFIFAWYFFNPPKLIPQGKSLKANPFFPIGGFFTWLIPGLYKFIFFPRVWLSSPAKSQNLFFWIFFFKVNIQFKSEFSAQIKVRGGLKENILWFFIYSFFKTQTTYCDPPIGKWQFFFSGILLFFKHFEAPRF